MRNFFKTSGLVGALIFSAFGCRTTGTHSDVKIVDQDAKNYTIYCDGDLRYSPGARIELMSGSQVTSEEEFFFREIRGSGGGLISRIKMNTSAVRSGDTLRVEATFVSIVSSLAAERYYADFTPPYRVGELVGVLEVSRRGERWLGTWGRPNTNTPYDVNCRIAEY